MIDFKKYIAQSIAKALEIDEKEIEASIENPKGADNGDYAFPCFRLAKVLKKAPQIIAEEIKDKLEVDESIITKTEVVGGYINFFVNKEKMTEDLLQDVAENEEYGK